MNFRTGSFAAGAVLCLSAAPALAQTTGESPGLCPALGTGGWIAGDAATSDAAMSAGPLDLTGIVVPPNGNAITYFSVGTPGEFRLEALPADGGDTVLELYAADGTLILTDDDGGGNFASRAETALDVGQYCMLTRAFGGGSVVADIRIARSEFDPITMGLDGGTGFFAGVETCTPDTPAVTLGQGPIDGLLAGSGTSAVNPIASVAYYRFTLATPQPISIRAENEWADPYLYLFDAQSQLLAENDDFDGLNARIDFTEPLAAGSYCVGLRALSDQNEPVTFSIRGYDAQQALFEMYATGEASPPEGSGYPVTQLGVLNTRLIMDQPVGSDATWYSFDVPAGGLVLIDAIEITDSDPVIRLYDSVGRMLEFNDDYGGGLDSQIVARVGPGNYMLAVTQYSSSYSGVIRVSLERYVPAE